MEKKEITHVLEKKFAEELMNILSHEGCLDDAGDDEVLESIHVDFEDGVTVEIDICNGSRDDNSSPYVNVNWHQDDEYLYAPVDEPEELIGTYEIETEVDDGNEINYIVNLAIGEDGQTFSV